VIFSSCKELDRYADPAQASTIWYLSQQVTPWSAGGPRRPAAYPRLWFGSAARASAMNGRAYSSKHGRLQRRRDFQLRLSRNRTAIDLRRPSIRPLLKAMVRAP
jgi:hypothetical protein